MQTLSFYLCHISPANSMGLIGRSEVAFLEQMLQVASTPLGVLNVFPADRRTHLDYVCPCAP